MKHLSRDRLRLAATYLVIIMVMSVGFSIIFYNVSAQQLERQRGPAYTLVTGNGPTPDLDTFLEQRAGEGKLQLATELVIINIFVLIVGSLLSYLLAEQTLQPIEDNMEAQAQFVGDASHELRTPLTAIRTSNEVALRNSRLTLKQARKVIESNVDDAKRLQELSEALLGLLADDDKTLFQHRVSVQSVVADAMNLVMPQAIEKDISVDDQTANLFVRGNEQGLVRLLTILLDNAVKYSDKGSQVAIKTEQHGRHIALRVIDHGIGMDGETQKQIFTRFYRADKARSRSDTDGYGLGLAIANKIVAAHDGKITAASQPGKGSTFTISLTAN